MRRTDIIKHIPSPDFKNRVEIMSGFNSDIIDVIHYNLPRAQRQVREIANFFKGADDLSTSRKIWDFLKKEIKYVKDPAGQQDIRLPGRFVAEGKGDCKSYSLFTGAILSNLGIPFSFRYASYSPSDPTPQHVYVITDSGVIIDAVWNSFNSEKKPAHKKDYPMKIQTLSGIGCTSCSNTSVSGSSVMIGDIGKISLKKAAKKVATAVKKPVLKNVQSAVKNTGVVKAAAKLQTKAKNTGVIKTASKLQSQVKSGGVKALIGAAPRRAYRTLIALNFRGWATKLASNTTKAKELWAKAGGSWPELEQSINAGKSKKALFGSKSQQIRTVDGIGSATVATVGTILALAAPIIALFKSLTGDEGTTSVPGDDTAGENGSTGDALKEIVNNVSNLFTGNQRPDTAAPQTQSAETSETPSTETSTVSTGLMLGAAALAAFLFLK